ncbi:Oidioi.mRNA.OKI2018_I69.PAR.g11770.t1.cds [Oikopleura dioica]|uniref:Oidioi.mRNA.OKI2018_I69.PAR.g11770.t1.cds n=1 Tax=Oikopleura dioica TaxID=34765 RepID=A0ABN7RXB4_OIKDI|nr:Oidioi.mRNA.OKI2018_I69.PAR.g11770.t1.cds [Oikopleura dioica]
MVGNLAKLKSNNFCCGGCNEIQPFSREPSVRELIEKYREYPSHFKKDVPEIGYQKTGKETKLRSIGVQAKIKKKKFSSFAEYMKNF